MPYVFMYIKYPLNKSDEVAKIYLESIKDYRSEIKGLAKEIVPNALKVTMEGIEAISVNEVKEGKLEEFTFAQGKAMLAYHAIEGFKYESEIRATVTEALELVGLKMPE
jgi:hypothetical protein